MEQVGGMGIIFITCSLGPNRLKANNKSNKEIGPLAIKIALSSPRSLLTGLLNYTRLSLR